MLSITLPFAGAANAAAQGAASGRDRDVKATLVAMWAGIEAGGVERYATYLHPDFTQFGENDAYLASGKALEVRSMTDYLRRASGVHTERHQAQVTVRGNVAWIPYYRTDSGMIAGQRYMSRGKSTRIFVKEDGRWRCIHGHYTAPP